MKGIALNNPPLVEAIFEMRWQVQNNLVDDPNYSLAIGRLYDKISHKYPRHEQLPTATIPTEMASGIVQHRFRAADSQWPLIQLGPGIFTLNEVGSYQWDDFSGRIIEGVKAFLESYPQKSLNIEQLTLRYINAIEFDFSKENILEFLRENLKLNISFPPSLFNNSPETYLDSKFSFKCDRPDTRINLRFARGEKEGKPALIWEIMVTSPPPANIPAKLPDWLNETHEIVETWFFELIQGTLLEQFR